jgi:hypothetical protein
MPNTLKQYNLKVTDKRQPMFIISLDVREISVPPEFCQLDSVSYQIKNNCKAMRTLLKEVK